jgi:uncharacterized protein YhfF
MSNKSQVRVFWESFCGTQEKKTECSNENYRIWPFGGDAQLQDRLVNLVLNNRKTATSGLKTYFEAKWGGFPEPGEKHVILNSSQEPCCVIETTASGIANFGDVPDWLPLEEGEGDQTLAYWKDVHRKVFLEQGATVNESTPIVWHRFRKLYPTDG